MAATAISRAFQHWLTKPRRIRRAVWRGCGFVGAVAVVFALGEIYLRVAPPSDLVQYLPESDRTGPFRNDPKRGVQYRSLEALAEDNPERFALYRPLLNHPNPPRTWAFFGSSFVQSPGMLGDTARDFIPQRVVFYLGKIEPLPVRVAQAEFLLDHGLKPERLFLVMIPLDVTFAKHGLDQYRATNGGALCYAPRLPPVGGTVVQHSRLALKGWTRTTMHQNLPLLRSTTFMTEVHPNMRADLRTVFANLAEAAARHHVAVTVVLVPNDAQVFRGAHFILQDTMAEDLRALGLDICDVRKAFLDYPDKPALYLPDVHFSPTGNRLLLATILEHLKATDPLATSDLPQPAEVRP